MIITPREYSTVRLGVESEASNRSIESSTIRGHPYHTAYRNCPYPICVHKRSFVFTECALVSMVMPLCCYAYAKNNSNSNTDVLPSRLRCSIIFRLVRQRQTCRKLEYAALFHAAVSAILFFFCFFVFLSPKRCVY